MKEIFHRINQYLFFAVLIVVVMYFGKPFLAPIFFAGLLAMLMAPVCRKFDSWGMRRGLSTFLCILILILVIALIGFIISTQISQFTENFSQIESKAKDLMSQAQQWIQEKIGMTPQEQEKVVKEQAEKSNPQGPGMPAKILGGIISTITGLVLTLVITFLMIFNKEQFQTFFLKLYRGEDIEKTRKIVDGVSQIGQKYLTGRAISITIIATLYSIGLLIVGVKNAILLGCIAAILTLIPYVGTVLGGLFPILTSLLTQDSTTALWAGVVMVVIQTIDNYFIEPNVVGGEVHLNALWSILSIIAGGLIWGVAGMIIFLPLFGIIKIICDHVQPLQPIGYILGEAGKKEPSKIKKWVMQKLGMKKSSGKR